MCVAVGCEALLRMANAVDNADAEFFTADELIAGLLAPCHTLIE